jgi:hypothetical protein
MHIQRLSQAGCLETARSWPAHADILRENARMSYLDEQQRVQLAHEAEAADRQTDSWLDAAEE